MCDHCGCREYPPIAELTGEHETILALAWQLAEANRACVAGPGPVREELLHWLEVHVAKEEDGLYPLLLTHGDLSMATSSKLEDEHRRIHTALAADAFDRREFYALAAHIEEEEMELFPAAMFAFDDASWGAMRAAHADADAGSRAPAARTPPCA